MTTTDRERWDARHGEADPPTASAPEALLAASGSPDRIGPGDRVLDVACGTGAQTLWALASGARVDAVDVSPVAIEQLTHAAAQHGWSGRLRAVTADLDDGLPAGFDGPYDLVIVQRFRMPALWAGLAARLRPRGVAATSVLSRVGVDGAPGEFHAAPGELAEVLTAAGLDVRHHHEGDGLATAVAERPAAVRAGEANLGLLHPLVAADVEASGIPVEVVECDPALADTAQFCEAYGYSPEDSANTIVVVGKAVEPVHAACVVLASTRLAVNSVVRRRLGTRKASFAPPEVTLELTGMEIGGVTALGLPADMPVWIDAAVLRRGRVILGGGNRSSKLLVDPRELAARRRFEVVEGLADPIAPSS